jgi:hypothetical protein
MPDPGYQVTGTDPFTGAPVKVNFRAEERDKALALTRRLDDPQITRTPAHRASGTGVGGYSEQKGCRWLMTLILLVVLAVPVVGVAGWFWL